ncbi:MAG: hypothetical protein J7L64_02620 [Acidobacteria bacterium]|nr:hypothetical protein [Acidobacteriota bacterium]
MGISYEEIEAKIASIRAELDKLAQSPEVDYQIGDKKVSASQKQAQLLAQLEYWERRLRSFPFEDALSFDYRITRFGDDVSDYEE